MINNDILDMVNVLNRRSVLVLEMILNGTWETSDFDDLDSLDVLCQAGWIDGVSDGYDCYWVPTDKGRKLYDVLADLII
jgi:hypothetical protein